MQVGEGGDGHHVIVLNDVVDILSLVNSPIIQRVTRRRRLKQKPDNMLLLCFPSLSVLVSISHRTKLLIVRHSFYTYYNSTGINYL